MVFTLHRYIFRELFRIFLLATIGLTLILSLGGILRPIQEYGVGPQEVLHILLYFMPITLTFVLPMAALFAAALTYGRFASDNELDACRASGISMATLVYPGLALALLVAIANLLLSFHVMPYFVHLAEKSLKADAKQILFRNIQRRGFYSLPPDDRYHIYADHVDPRTDTLFGIVAVESEKKGIRRIIPCEYATARFDPHDKFNEVHLRAFNTRQIGTADDMWFVIGTASLKLEFGSLLGDDIKFKRIDEMKQIRADLMRFDPIAKMARETYVQLITEVLANDINRLLAASGADGYELVGSQASVRLVAANGALEKEQSITFVTPVAVEEYDRRRGEKVHRLRCEKAVVYVRDDAGELRLDLDLSNARDERTGQLFVHHAVRDLLLPPAVTQRLGGRPVLETVMAAPSSLQWGAPPSPMLASLQKSLDRKISRTLLNIKAEINSRLVFGIGCIPMILIGIGLGVMKRGGHLLSAFGASCVPGAVLIVAIVSGKHVTENVGSQAISGILVMWGGLAFLSLLTVLIYGRLLRR